MGQRPERAEPRGGLVPETEHAPQRGGPNDHAARRQHLGRQPGAQSLGRLAQRHLPVDLGERLPDYV